MSLDLNASTPIVIPARKKRSRGIWLALAALGVLGGSSAWGLGLLGAPSRWFRTPMPIATVDVDEGEISRVVTENGTLESSNNATARCHVEALIGMVGGSQGGGTGRGGQGGRRSQGGGMSGQSGQSGQGQQGQSWAQTQLQSQAQSAKAKTKTKVASGASKAKAAAGATKAGGASQQSDGPAQATSTGGSGGGGGGGGGGDSGGSGAIVVTKTVKPVIRSFTYQVVPHQPLRPKTQGASQQTSSQQGMDAAMMAGGGGGRGGPGGGGPGRGGPGGSSGSMERPGSTRIISILPEGTWVKGPDLRLTPALNDLSGIPTTGKSLIIVATVDQVLHFRLFDVDGKVIVDTDERSLAERATQIDELRGELETLWPPHELTPSEKGQVVTAVTSLIGQTQLNMGDLVCELDAADFRDELRLQTIRCHQAQSWVEQAKSLLEVSEISYREYRDGIYPQDVQLIRQYIQTCRTEADRASRAYVWSKETTAKGYRSPAQLKADELAMQQAQILLGEATGMEIRLEKHTADKLKKSLEAKIAAIRADKLAQEQAFELESDRKRKLERMVAYCTIRAPGDGIVVHANVPNREGRIESPIAEGATVRQGQPLFFLPDPNLMQVKAKVNESKVALIQSGQPAKVVIDAFPDRPLRGSVTEITPIPAPASAASSDVRVYFAVVRLESGGFTELRPGLSAEVTFLIDNKPSVTRVPLQAVIWANEKSYVAVQSNSRTKPESGKKEPLLPGQVVAVGVGQNATYFEWQPVVLGASNRTYFEVLSGLKPGEKVHAQPETLPPPPRIVTPRQNVAARDARPQS